MTLSSLRRAALLGITLGPLGCDVVDFVSNPMPRFEQTWNLPAAGTTISVASLLPPGITIYNTPSAAAPDSAGFDVDVDDIVFSRRLGADCLSCNGLNGTTAVKPAFTLQSGNSDPLPQDMISGSVIGGQVNVTVQNNLSFDPLRVRAANPQGHMVIVVRSGSLVLGRDSVNGANTPLPAGAALVRTIQLTTGTVTSSITVDLTIESPQGDAPVFINANGTVNATAVTPSLVTATMRMNVVNKSLASASSDTISLDGIKPNVAEHVVAGALAMSITNPFAVTGNMDVRFGYAPGAAVTESVALPTGVNQPGLVSLDSADMQAILGRKVALTVGGVVNSAAPITVAPKQRIAITNRLILTIRTGGGT